MIGILKFLLAPLFRNWKPCKSCREGFPTFPRRVDPVYNTITRSQCDLIYCDRIEGHAGQHRGLNKQTERYWYWSVERVITPSEEIKDDVVYYDVSEYWKAIDKKYEKF